MKKILLSLALIFIFGIYVFYEKTQAEAQKVDTINIPTNTTQSISTDTSTETSTSSPSSLPFSASGLKDGTYTGDRTDAFFGFIQVKAIISGGKISDVVFLEYPSDRQTSIEINTSAMPVLKSEAIKAQNAQVDIVSGATQTSDAFKQSLASALTKAKS